MAPLPLLLPAQDPAPVQAATEAAGQLLEQALLPLFLYCEKAVGRPDLSDGQFQHVQLIRAALDALAAYDAQVQQELRVHRANVAGLNQHLHGLLASQHPTPLASALQPDWQGLALALLDQFCDPTAPVVLPAFPRPGRTLTGYTRHLVRLGLLLASPADLAALTPPLTHAA